VDEEFLLPSRHADEGSSLPPSPVASGGRGGNSDDDLFNLDFTQAKGSCRQLFLAGREGKEGLQERGECIVSHLGESC